MRQVVALAREPGLCGLGVEVVGARFDDVRDAVAEYAANAVEHRASAAVLDAVVQHRRDRFGLVTAVLEDEAGDDEQVGEIGDLGPDPALLALDLAGQRDGSEEPVSDRGRGNPPHPDGRRRACGSRCDHGVQAHRHIRGTPRS